MIVDENHDCEGCPQDTDVCLCCVQCYLRTLAHAQDRASEQQQQEQERRCGELARARARADGADKN